MFNQTNDSSFDKGAQVAIARWLALVSVTTLALYLCWLMLRPFVEVLAWAAVLVIVFHPLHQRLARLIGRPGLSAFASSLIVIAVVFLPCAFTLLALAGEASRAAQSLTGRVDCWLDSHSPLESLLTWLRQRVPQADINLQQLIAEQLNSLSGAIVGHSFALLGGLVVGVVKLFFIIFTMYYLFRDGDRILRALPAALPLEPERSAAIVERTREVVGASVYGVVIIALAQGALGGLAFAVLGLPSPVLWAAVMALVCMIPVAGSFLVWLPAALFLAATGHWPKAIFLVLWGALVISTIDNFLRPRLIKGRAKLHELFVFFAVLGGLRLFGVLGIVLGPVVLAITLALLETFKQSEPQSPAAAQP